MTTENNHLKKTKEKRASPLTITSTSAKSSACPWPRPLDVTRLLNDRSRHLVTFHSPPPVAGSCFPPTFLSCGGSCPPAGVSGRTPGSTRSSPGPDSPPSGGRCGRSPSEWPLSTCRSSWPPPAFKSSTAKGRRRGRAVASCGTRTGGEPVFGVQNGSFRPQQSTRVQTH